jgi:hypothetical protein
VARSRAGGRGGDGTDPAERCKWVARIRARVGA